MNDSNMPNIILIILDCLRSDKLSKKYKNIELTPNINKLLDNSFIFTNCITNSPWTLPSHTTIFTNLYPSQHNMISTYSKPLDYKIPTIQEILKAFGYYTICYTENAFISKRFGLSRGFINYISNLGEEIKSISKIINPFIKLRDIIESKIKHRFIQKYFNKMIRGLKIILEHIFWYEKRVKNDTIKELKILEKILSEKKDNRPIYAFFNIMATHNYYIPLKRISTLFNINYNDYKIIKDFFINPSLFNIKINILRKKITHEQLNSFNKLYCANVYYGDLIVKKIIDILKKFKLLNNSYLIITSDHGEHLGEKNLWEHKTWISVYEPVIRVPLILYNKSLSKKTINDQVDLKSLYDTILHLTNIPPIENKYLQIENSLIYRIKNKNFSEYIFGEYLKSSEDKKNIKKYLRFNSSELKIKAINDIKFLRSNNYKYIRYGNKIEEFYNLIEDPNEHNNIFDEKSEICRKMKEKLYQIMIENKKSDVLIKIKTKKEKDRIKEIIRKQKFVI
ncbi:MAG: sulfatase-like hydrolase/transferase [Candidatus Helarchaeota archaeon]